MASGAENFLDPGGGSGNKIDGSHAGRTIPSWMDPRNECGRLSILRLEGDGGVLPKNPFLIRTSIEKSVNGKIEGAFTENQGTMYALKVRNEKQLEKLLRVNSLLDGTKVKICHHPNLNKSRFVVSCKEVIDIPEKDLVDYLKPYDITDVRRITKKNGLLRENTSTIIATINGTTIPDYIEFGYVRCKTRPYYPSPMQCFQCWSFGHTRLRCQQTQQKCGNCSQIHAFDDENKCHQLAFCSKCNSDSHSLSSKQCPAYITEKEIQHIKVDSGVSYPMARKMLESRKNTRSFSGIVTAGKDQRISSLVSELEKLKIEIINRDRRISQLESSSSTTNRLELIQKHGTIEELVTENMQLKAKENKKDHEISVLRKILSESKNTKHIIGGISEQRTLEENSSSSKQVNKFSLEQQQPKIQKAKKCIEERPTNVTTNTNTELHQTKRNMQIVTRNTKAKITRLGSKEFLREVFSDTSDDSINKDNTEQFDNFSMVT